jgi:hypothetical protein
MGLPAFGGADVEPKRPTAVQLHTSTDRSTFDEINVLLAELSAADLVEIPSESAGDRVCRST